MLFVIEICLFLHLWLYKKGKNKQVKMNSKIEKHLSRRLNVQVCELLQVLTKADIKRCSEK